MRADRKQILFVDDDAQFLALLRDIMAGHAGEAWNVLTAPDVGRALGLLREQRIDLLVVDVHMPVIDGLEFLTLLRRTYPSLLRVALTGDATESYRAACLNAGAELFLAKPVTPEGWRSIYSTLDALLSVRPAEGFRGVLRTVGLQDILQMECLARNSSILEVTGEDAHGRIVIEQGQIVHAVLGHCQGEEAFHGLLTLKGGEFNLLPFSPPAERTLTGSWEFLLMEAARQRDEAAAPPFPGPADLPAATESIPPPFPPGPTPRQASVLDPRPRIDEMLIASADGEVLYEWHCPDPAERIRFLEFVTQHAEQLGRGLPLGPLDRMELLASQRRALTQVRHDRTVFMQSSVQPAGGA